MSVTAKFNLLLNAAETPALAIDMVADQALPHAVFTNTINGTLDSSTSVPVTKKWSDSGALGSGTLTLDLAALAHGNLPTVNFTGLKVQLFKFAAMSTNSAAIKIIPGSSNGYNIFGHASGWMEVLAGMAILMYGAEKLDDVAGADKTIDLSSSDVDAAFEIEIVAG